MTKYFVRPLFKKTGLTECSALEVDARFSYPGMILFYPVKLDPQRLRSALARVLSDFPEYAGRFVASSVRLQIRHAEGSVPFEESRVDATLEHMTRELQAGRTKELEPRVSLLRLAGAQEAALLVHWTELRDGCALALGWNHAVGDTHSTMLLLRAWVAAYENRDYDKPVLITDRDAYFRSVLPKARVRSAASRSGLARALALRLAVFKPAARVSIELTWAELTAIKLAFGSAEAITLNDVLCAHVCTVLRQLSGATEQTRLCLVVNFRNRLGLPHGVLGNMTSLLCHPVDELDTPSQIATGIRQGLRNYATEQVNYHATMRVFHAAPRPSQRIRLVSRQFEPGSGDLLVTNWNNFGAYSLAFGASTPTLFHPIILGATQLPQWCMIVFELPQNRGVGVTIGLPRAVAERWRSAEGQALLRGAEYKRERPSERARRYQLHSTS